MAYFARHGVFFALILEEFLGNILHDGVEERGRERCGLCCQKQNIENSEFTELMLLLILNHDLLS